MLSPKRRDAVHAVLFWTLFAVLALGAGWASRMGDDHVFRGEPALESTLPSR